MKRRKIGLAALVLAAALLLSAALLTDRTWAWKSLEEHSGGHLTIGTVDHRLTIRQDGREIPDGVLEPGTYSVTVTATGNIDGWFRLQFYPLEGIMEDMTMRTRRMQPGEALSFTLILEGKAWLTVQSRWDGLWTLPEVTEGMEIPFGAKGEESDTVPPATTLPPETTVPPATTLPPETTVPPATTMPPETTVPPATTVPAPPASE